MEENSITRRIYEPIFIGLKGSEYPTTRPDGSALQTGDYVGILGTPDIERYCNGKWILNGSVWQNTDMVPIFNGSQECYNASAKTQYDVNKSFVDHIKEFVLVGQLVYDTESTESAMKSKYPGTNSWELVMTDYGTETVRGSLNGFTTVAQRTGLICTFDAATQAAIATWNQNDIQIATALPESFSCDLNLKISEGHAPAYGEMYHWADVKRIGPVWFNGNNRVIYARNCSGTNYSNQTFRGYMIWNAEASRVTPVGYYWKRTA